MERRRLLIALATVLLSINGRELVVEAQDNCTNVTEPQNVTANSVSFSCVDVSWTAPSDPGGNDSATITRYHITWNGENHAVEDGTSTSYQVMGLTPETSYSFTVTAENNCNMISPGATAMATTEAVPAVTNVTAQPVNSSAITVQWVYNETVCESVDSFVVNYSIDSRADMMMNVTEVSSRSVDITGLADMQGTYSISVKAVYQSVTSADSITVMVDFRTPSPPGGVTATATSGSSITVTWTPPVVSANRPPVTGYTVTAVPSDGSTPVQNTTSTTTTVLNGLQEGTTYNIQVVASNIVGDSTAVNRSAMTFARPSLPEDLSVILQSSNSIKVQWTEPAIDGGDASINYTIVLQGSPGAMTRTETSTSTTFTGLVPPNTYTVQVTAVNSAGSSAPANGTIAFQVPAEPTISDLTASSTALTVTWTNTDTSIEVDDYEVAVLNTNSQVDDTRVESSITTATLDVTDKNVTYTVTVTAVNKVGSSSSASRMFYFAVPLPPTGVTATATSASSITVRWTPPVSPDNGAPVTGYTVTAVPSDGSTPVQTTDNTTSTELNGLMPNTTYTIQVVAINGVGGSAPGNAITTIASPTEPLELQLSLLSNTSIRVQWMEPASDRGSPVVSYSVTLQGSPGAVTRNETSTSTTFTGLVAPNTYTVQVTAVNSVGPGPPVASSIHFQVPAEPSITNLTASSTALTVTWTNTNTGIEVDSYDVAVLDGNRLVNDTRVGSSVTTATLVVTDKGVTYTVTVTAVNKVGLSSPASRMFYFAGPTSDATVYIGVGVGCSLVCLCLLAVVVIVCLVVWRKKRTRIKLSRRRGPRQMKVWDSGAQFTDTIRMAIHGEGANLSGSQQDLIGGQEESPLSTPVLGRKELTPSHPVSLDSFVGYIESTPREELIAQYRSIPNKTHDLMALALMNPLSNRYINILPYDKNRVVLSEPNSDGNDYINASYINSYDKENSFIAAQGPLQRTADDFWQMVWDQKATVVVMLTKCMEGTKSKCAEYFPRNVGGRVFIKMNIAVENKSMHVFKDYEIRMLEVKNCKADITRTVQHFYYIGWPDFGVPDSPTGVLTMLHHVRAIRRSGDPDVPSIIHCSAGVGRTGTFIALDHLVQQVQTEGDNAMIDIEALVSTMRTQRGTMVQASEQYVFIHRALREYLLLGYTMMSGPDLKAKVEEMSPVKRHSGISHFQEQYERLEYITAPYTKAPKVAEEFLSKIRFPDKGPYEGKYLRITPVAGDFSSSFVNASLVDGYRQTKQFIVAQSPMHSTTGDFWALVYEKRCPTVVLLCAFQENGEESSVRFWPSEVGNTENFFGYKVTCKSEDVSSSFTTLQLVVQPEGEDLSPLEVTLYHLDDWSAATMPSSGSLLSLLDTARAGQRKGSTSPVVVACNDGLGRSCLFVSLWVLTEQLAMEDQVDVVGTFKSVRSSRPGAMDSLDYFIHCYHILVQYREIHNPTPEDSGYV